MKSKIISFHKESNDMYVVSLCSSTSDLIIEVLGVFDEEKKASKYCDDYRSLNDLNMGMLYLETFRFETNKPTQNFKVFVNINSLEPTDEEVYCSNEPVAPFNFMIGSVAAIPFEFPVKIGGKWKVAPFYDEVEFTHPTNRDKCYEIWEREVDNIAEDLFEECVAYGVGKSQEEAYQKCVEKIPEYIELIESFALDFDVRQV